MESGKPASDTVELVLFWFRRDLRLHDNHGLYEALKSGLPVLPVFIFDTCILGKLQYKKDRRMVFIHQVLEKLHRAFAASGSTLLVMKDDPLEAFRKITERFHIKAVYTNHDYEPYAVDRDLKIKDFLHSKGISFLSFGDQVIFEKSDVVKEDGSPYTVFTPYSKKWRQKLETTSLKTYPGESLLERLHQMEEEPMPSLEEIGFESFPIEIPPERPEVSVLTSYHLVRNLPSQNTSRMGVPLRFGTVSIREMVRLGRELNETWLQELIWREFFMMILFHFPDVEKHSFKTRYDRIPWINDEGMFHAWCEGRTGYPLVDAGMRELNETGFMHNRVRMVTASFLTKHLLIDWRWGEAYFARKLFDYELSSNNGNWQWAAGCGCDAAPYFRVFNPHEQARKFDPDKKYITHWIQEAADEDPAPVVDHEEARKRAVRVYRSALSF